MAARRVGWGFISLFLAPLLVTRALKVILLVGIEQAPGALALVAGRSSS